MGTPDSQPPDHRELRRYLRDLAALTALPAVWSGGDRHQIARGAAEVVVKVLDLDFSYVRLEGSTEQDTIEVARFGHGPDAPDPSGLISRVLSPLLTGNTANATVFSLPHPDTEGLVNAALTPIGYGGEFGVLVAASRRPGFPTEEDRLLHGVVANQAAVVTQRHRAEAALRRSERELADFFENASLGLHWVGPDGTILRVNQAELDLLGYTHEEYLGHHISEFHADQEVISDILRRLQAGEELRDREARLRCKDGSVKYVLINSNVLWEEDRFVHTRCFTRDITDRRLAEEAFRKQAEWLRVTLASIGDAVITTDCEGRITSLNPVAESLTGWTRHEAQGMPLGHVFRIINEQGRQPVEDPATRSLQEGRVVGLANHTLLIAKDGTERAIDDSAAPIRDEHGNVLGVVLVFRDVAEKRRAGELNERLAAIVESSDDAIVSKTLDGIITGWNKGAERMLGYSAEEVIGRHVSMIIPPEHAEDVAKILGSIRRGEWVEHYETKRRRKDGKVIDVSLTVSPIRDASGRVIGASKIGRDITGQKLIEAERKEAERCKDEFLATLAHELRNPLAPIRNSMEVLRLSNDREAMQSAREMMERQIHHIVRLVDDLMDLSRISRGKIQLNKERIELGTILQGAIEASRPLIEAAGHELTVTLPPERVWLEADATRMTQVVANLLNNATKYTQQGGHIWLTAEEQGHQAVLRVRDTGIGISAHMLERVFEMFAQVDSALDRSQGGLGIGLTLVKTLVELHDGTVEAQSAEAGGGSEFIVRLPATVGKLEIPAQKRKLEADRRPISNVRRILVVDDNLDSAQSLAMLLRLIGNETCLAHDGPRALEAAGTYRPEVVLLDIGLPGMNGYEVARRMRELPHLRDVLLVAITGWAQEEDRRRCRDAGFDHHLTKPADLVALEKLLASLTPSNQSA